ncbi:MAG: AIR synthase-related protein, partial [Acidobacteriota bacterium]|nr:AIR synthase-related protein [Acidobacteriota bacterium]
GLRGLASQHNVPLAGGDTSESPNALVLADIVLVGSAPAGRALRRSGGRASDILYVTGRLGGAAAELATLGTPSKRDPSPSHPQLYPQPRLAVGQALLRRRLATAAIDLSDGLSTDLAHLCRESAVGAEVSESALPIHPLAAKFGPVRALDLTLNGGEDYELLFTAPPSVCMPRSIYGVPITRIGRLVPGTAVTIIDSTGGSRDLKPGGWEHFAGPHASKTKTPRRK